MKTNGDILKQVFVNGNYGTEQQKSTLANAKRIYSKLPSSTNDIKSNVGLVVGRVQSGKTANIITLSALALDNDYKVIVLFLSDTNNLLTQNTERFLKNFGNIDNVLVTKKSKDGDFDTLLDKQTLETLHETGQKLIICSLKHSKHIADIKNLLSKTPYKDDYTLIIDDEGDDIGLNTAAFAKKFACEDDSLIETDSRTATNREIINLKSELSKLGYISLTATPEANILLQSFQELAPDYCVTLEPNAGYTGLLSFHGADSNKTVVIEDNSELLEDRGLPESFADAFTFFIAGCMIRTSRHGSKVKHSMMVHPCHKMDNHNIVYKKIEAYIDHIKSNLSTNNQSGQNFVTKVVAQVNSIDPNLVVNNIDVLQTIKRTKLHLVNSREQSSDLHKAMSLMPYHIVVGGNMLDRGITVEGLAVTYMIRVSRIGQADTLLQRARWFGYKESYFDLCRVYLPFELKRQFEKLIELEESVWDFLYMCDKHNLIPRNIDVNILTPQGMRAAASNKAVSTTTSLPSTTREQREIVQNTQWNADNIKWASSHNWNNSTIVECTKSQIHRRITIPTTMFLKDFEMFHFADASSNLNHTIIKTIIEQGGFKNIDLWDMRYNTGQERSTANYRVLSLLQGYSESKRPGDPDYYVGDRNLKTDNLSIQIHHVRLLNDIDNQYKKGDEVILLALILPEGYVNIGSLTRRMTTSEIIDKLNNISKKTEH